VSLFWLEYRYHDGRFAGAVVLEATAPIIARMEAAVFGLDRELDFAGAHQIDAESARRIPDSMIGRLLDDADLRRLQQVLVSKKPPAPSVKVRPGHEPRRTSDAEPRRRSKPVPVQRRRV
jgi:hypothetical protein